MIRARAVSASGAVSPGGGHDAQSVARRRRSSSVSEGNRYAYHHLRIARFCLPAKSLTLKKSFVCIVSVSLCIRAPFTEKIQSFSINIQLLRHESLSQVPGFSFIGRAILKNRRALRGL